MCCISYEHIRKIAEFAITNCKVAMITGAGKKLDFVPKFMFEYDIISKGGLDSFTVGVLTLAIYEAEFRDYELGLMYALNIAAIFHMANKDGEFNVYKEAMDRYVEKVNAAAKEIDSNASDLDPLEFGY